MGSALETSPVFVKEICDLDEYVEGIHGARIVPCFLSDQIVPSTHRRILFSDACLDFHSIGPTILFEGDMPEDRFMISFVVSCPDRARSFNFGISHQESVMGFFPPGGKLDAIATSGSDHAILTISRGSFLKRASEIWPDMPDELLAGGAGLPVNVDEVPELTAILNEIKDWETNSISTRFADAFALEDFKETLLTQYLMMMRNAVESPAPVPARLAAIRCRKLESARNYIAAHLGENVEVAEIAEASDLSERGLQKLFHTQVGLSPIAFHRRLRLCGANLDLHYSAEELGGVKRIALKWGFWHHGRFAREYRELFGENPSETLLRGRQKHRDLKT